MATWLIGGDRRAFMTAGPGRQRLQFGQGRHSSRLGELEQIIRLQEIRHIYHRRPHGAQDAKITRHVGHERLLRSHQVAELRRRVNLPAVKDTPVITDLIRQNETTVVLQGIKVLLVARIGRRQQHGQILFDSMRLVDRTTQSAFGGDNPASVSIPNGEWETNRRRVHKLFGWEGVFLQQGYVKVDVRDRRDLS